MSDPIGVSQPIGVSTRSRDGSPATEATETSPIVRGNGHLLPRAFGRVLDVDPGFRSDHVIGFRVTLPAPAYPTPERRVAFADALLERVRAIPGVTLAGAASYLPLEPADMTGVEVEGRAPRPNEQGPAVVHIAATPGYVEAMGLRVVTGRAFREEDGARVDPSPAIVSESFAHGAWPGANPIGRRIRNHGSPGWMEVVGVARDVRQLALEEGARMFVYEPYPRLPVPYLSVALRGAVDPRGLVAPVRGAVRALDPDLPLFDVMSMDERVSRSLWARRAYSWLIGSFAAVALVLAVAGLYGVLSYSVSQRTREIAIRVAFGARPRMIAATVLGHGMRLVAAGCALGLGTALFAGGLLRSLLFGVSPRDPVTLAAALLVVVSTALVANFVPARRAAVVDPNSVLRSE